MSKKPVQSIVITARKGGWTVAIHRYHDADKRDTQWWRTGLYFVVPDPKRIAFLRTAQDVLYRMGTEETDG
jgi:hypothetical protein